MATNPFEQPLASEQAKASPAAGNPFDQPLPSEQSTAPQEQPGFLSRAYEASPLPGMWDAAKGAVSDFVNAPVQGEQNFHAMTDALRAGNFREAAGHAAQLLVGDANPFTDAAKSVISGLTKDAHQAGRDIQTRNLSAIPVIGTAASNDAKDVAAGNSSAAAGDVVGGVTSVLPMLLGDEASTTRAGYIAGKVGDALIPEKLRNAVSDVADKVTGDSAQPAVQSAVRGAAEDTAASEGVQPKVATSVRDAIQNTSDSILGRSKAAFQTLDDVSGGRWQSTTKPTQNMNSGRKTSRQRNRIWSIR